MDLPAHLLNDFLFRYYPVNLRTLQAPPPTQEPAYVVIAFLTHVHTNNASGIDVTVRDHTGTAVLALRGMAKVHFYDAHLPGHDPRHPVEDPFALAGTWFGTYLFKIDTSLTRAPDGRNGIIVNRICMRHDVIYDYSLIRMTDEDVEEYSESFAVAVPSGPGYPRGGLDIAPNRAGCVGRGVGFRKGVYGQLSP